MFDARFYGFATISALLVISPGATMAVVMETAVGAGKAAALYTVLGVNIGNSSLALSSALGMSVVFRHWPWMLDVVRIGGSLYLAYLGVLGLRAALRPTGGPEDVPPAGVGVRPAGSAAGRDGSGDLQARPLVRACLARGVLTNLLNPSVVLFYMTLLPQFIGPRDPFFARFLVLAGTHVSMSLMWLFFYALAMGAFAERLMRPSVRRWLEGLTGVILIGLGLRLLF